MDSNEKSIILCEFGSFVQLIREKSASTLLVPGMTLAIPAQKRRRSLYLVPSGLQHSSNDCMFSLICACSKTAFNPISSLTAILSCRNCSSICSIASSDSFWRSRILCCCRDAVNNHEFTLNKSSGSTGGISSVPLVRASRSTTIFITPVTICNPKFAKLETISWCFARSALSSLSRN